MNTMQLDWQLDTKVEQATVSLIGVLNRHTLLPLWQQRQHFVLSQNAQLSSCQKIIWDLNAISHIDSAGFALLTELLMLNPLEQVCLVNVPEQCLNLAALFSLKEWLAKYIKQ
ncbi:STAS domain-containing protein [Gallibacterium genomosp. 3]|uniref:Anti-anti-sigma factor n=1 Tax=Gallibacterium genomosp. 3 TaxID=505345 RepID=A0A1A7PU96_9PAST|nr:anti-anti-sigma factor [Gallibacterium genomosp. 3]OBX05624.1 anti-anti-sigma factor [Gallibacterium genomosp. 3]